MAGDVCVRVTGPERWRTVGCTWEGVSVAVTLRCCFCVQCELGAWPRPPHAAAAAAAAGVCSLRASTADMGKVARYTLLYYLSTTMGAVVLGIVVVNIVRVRGGGARVVGKVTRCCHEMKDVPLDNSGGRG